jgi:hypothetical protein
MMELSKAAADVLAERQRQLDVEGWSIAHDDDHDRGELSRAGAAFAFFGSLPEDARKSLRAAPLESPEGRVSILGLLWPKDWLWLHFKPKGRRRDLVRGAALIIAEIERLDRAGIRG